MCCIIPVSSSDFVFPRGPNIITLLAKFGLRARVWLKRLCARGKHPSCVFVVTNNTRVHARVHAPRVRPCLSPAECSSENHTRARLTARNRGRGGPSVFRAALQVSRTLIHQTPALCHFLSAATFGVKEEHRRRPRAAEELTTCLQRCARTGVSPFDSCAFTSSVP